MQQTVWPFLHFFFRHCIKFQKWFNFLKRRQLFHCFKFCCTSTLLLICTNTVRNLWEFLKWATESSFWFLCRYRLASLNTNVLSSKYKVRNKIHFHPWVYHRGFHSMSLSGVKAFDSALLVREDVKTSGDDGWINMDVRIYIFGTFHVEI